MLGFGSLMLLEESNGYCEELSGSSPSHSGGITSSEEGGNSFSLSSSLNYPFISDINDTDSDTEAEVEEDETMETEEVEEDKTIEAGEVVWAKVSGWRWWPGVVRERKRVSTVVDFFGEDHRGMNTSASLVSHLIIYLSDLFFLRARQM